MWYAWLILAVTVISVLDWSTDTVYWWKHGESSRFMLGSEFSHHPVWITGLTVTMSIYCYTKGLL